MLARFVTALLIALPMLVSAPASAPSTQTPAKTVVNLAQAKPEFREINFDRIRKLKCSNPKKPGWHSLGTGFMVGDDVLITAAHVLDEQCRDSVTDTPAEPYYIDWDNDIALVSLKMGPLTDVMEISCAGYETGERYSAIGFAKGSRLRETRLTAKETFTPVGSEMSYSKDDRVPAIHVRNLKGDIYQGMSGGPILDESGLVVGINTFTDGNRNSGSRELRDTILCKSNPRRNPDGYKVLPHVKVQGAKLEK